MAVVQAFVISKPQVPNRLPCKRTFDTVVHERARPTVGTVGLLNASNENSDSEKSDDGSLNNSIVSEVPNLYKQSGTSMSKLPYFFDTPVPRYFRENGWFHNENTWKFVTWAFSKCSSQIRTTIYDNMQLILEPFEFICGREKNSAECFLTPKEFRGQLISMLKAGMLKKGANSRANRFSSYIWVTEHFSEYKGQLQGQPRANRGPTEGHNQEYKSIEYKKDHPHTPSLEKKSSDELTDDFSSKKESEKKELIFSGKYPDETPYEVYLSKSERDECIKIHGSMARVLDVIRQVAGWEDRVSKIRYWPRTIKSWIYKNCIVSTSMKNEALGKELEKAYESFPGWTLRVYHDKSKDQRGVLFEGKSGTWFPVFVEFTNPRFEELVYDTINKKKMKKSG